MQGKDTIKSTFKQLFESVISFNQCLNTQEVDKYVKKFTFLKFMLIMICAQLYQLDSLRDISSTFKNDELATSLDLSSISASQLSRKQRAELMEPVTSLFAELIQQAGITEGFDKLRQKLGSVYLIDSTVISLCLSQYRWAYFRKTKSGIKVHTRLKLLKDKVLPDAAVITAAKKADRTQMDELIVEEENAFHVFDRAYVDYKKFDHYCEQNIRFASRLKDNAVVQTLENFEIDDESHINHDSKVLLGNKHSTKMRNPLRIIETTDTEGKSITIVTNDFELSAEEIGDLYRYQKYFSSGSSSI